MDCKKAQQLFDDLSQDRLAPEVAAQVSRHLAECTDCRVLEHRAARLQRLLALKRYERPSPQYFNGFLPEFHSRLAAEAQRTRWWERVVGRMEDFLAVDSAHVWRYRFASAVGVAAAVGLTWMGVRQTSDSPGSPDQTAVAISPLVVTETMLPPPQSTPSAIAASLPGALPDTATDSQPATSGSMDLVLAPVHADSPMPRYVLDHLSVTPASYDVASVHF
jgi:hypothetical protein